MIKSFVAAELGFWDDPMTQDFCRAVHNPEGGAFILRLRELVRKYGTPDGQLRRPDGGKYSAEQIAAGVHWRGPVRKLIWAFERAGVLRRRRGLFVYPGWAGTITGHYVTELEADARYRRKVRRQKRREGLAAAPGAEGDEESGSDVRGTSAGRPGGRAPDVDRTSERSKRRHPPDPPGAPPEGGRETLSRWFLETYPKVRNRRKIETLLAQLTDEEEAQLRYCLPRHAPVYVGKTNKKGWRFVPYGDTYLERGIFWEFRPPKPKPEANGDAAAERSEEARAAAAAEEARERTAQIFQRRAAIKSRLLEEGVKPGPELEERVDAELGIDPS